MSYLKNKLQEKLRRYMRRKHRVNETIKSQNPEFRLLVERSNLYVKAQVLGRDGKVIASTTDKGAHELINQKELEMLEKLSQQCLKISELVLLYLIETVIVIIEELRHLLNELEKVEFSFRLFLCYLSI